ncbi:AraC family transcriptional regulator [Sphingomonadaceae bacterium OTU29LAMAA1]|nr:AraC family transcriptional regulator [Sphingomonadaceae bacterium OTU29LAMAA1]
MATTDGLSLFRAVLNRLDAASDALTICEVAANLRVIAPVSSAMGALLVIDGSMHLHCGRERQIVRSGETAIIPASKPIWFASCRQSIGAAIDSRGHLVRRGSWLVSDVTCGRKRVLQVAMVKISGTKADWLDEPASVSLTACDSGKQLFELLRTQCDSHDPGTPALAQTLVNACLVQALKTSNVNEVPQRTHSEVRSPLLVRALDEVRARPAEMHTTDTLAHAAGMSRSTFIRQLARFAHASPMEYIRRVRLEEAAIMLRSDEAAIKTIAAATGFRSRSHFSRTFRLHYGTDPSAFRDANAERHAR